MTCEVKAPVTDVSSDERGRRDAANEALTRCGSGVSLGFVRYHIVVDTTSEASTAYLVRRDRSASMTETGASTLVSGSDFCAMLLAMAGHELRQPLQIITAAHDVLDLRLAGQQERRQLERIERASAQLATKLELLLQALRLRESTGKSELEPVWVDAVLQQLAGELSDRARHRRVELRLAGAKVHVWSQAMLLSAMLGNLLRNAIDYSPAGGRVLAGCRRRGATVRIEVHDCGAGIPEAEREGIFQAFQRGATSRPDGLGLGLFIVKRSADFLEHRIELRSAAGQGSCFTVIADAHSPFRDRHFGPVQEEA